MPNDRAPRGAKPSSGRPKAASGGSRTGGKSAGAPRSGGASGGRSSGGAKPSGGSRFGSSSGSSYGGGKPARGGAKGAPRGASEGHDRKPSRGASSEGYERKPSRGAAGESYGRKPARGASSEGFERKGARGASEGFDRKPARGAGGEGFGRGPRSDSFDRKPARAPREESFERQAPHTGRDDFEAHSDDDAQGGDIVFGRHAALATLEGNQAVNKVWVLNGLRNQELISKVRQLAKEKGAIVQMVERPKLDALTLEGNHQGIVVSVAMAAYVDLDEVIERAKATEHPALLMLDGIEDPHNLGALIRSAEGAGFTGVIIPNRRAVGITPVAVKSSAGATSRVPVARVGNLSQAVETLHKAGFWVMGADAEGEKLPYEIDMTQPIVVVIGSEGKGLSRLLAEKCDWRVRLQLGGELESLNASVAGAVLMYEAVRQRWAKQG